MKVLILIAVILTFTACFSSSESSEEYFKLPKQLRSKLSRRYSAKFQRVPGSPCGHSVRHEAPRGHHPLHLPHHPHIPHGPSFRPTLPPENIIYPSSQAPSAPFSAPPTIIYTTATVLPPPLLSLPLPKTLRVLHPALTASSALQPEDITNALEADTTTPAPVADTTTPAPVADTTAVYQQQELQ
ncbi:unnamed protein product [Nyctereutes procyonoides]|uniref:(raccoon dog) hypothetical protein n=1 Tax=Nyctereutes procyonoides TaxID=34880 RepID=A0A811Y3V1_NYCPR|nr:unnamed protein product [Nyctereutes procyonoides]